MELFTWQYLATMAGCICATALVVQFVKAYFTWPTQLLSYIVALAIFNAANAALGVWDWQSALKSILDSVIVALSSNGGYDLIQRIRYGSGANEDTENQGGDVPDQGGAQP